MGQRSSGRVETLDLLKLAAAYMVVFIHVPFYGLGGTIVSALARFAVPIFFMTSGYFCYQNDAKQIGRKVIKIVYILIFTSLLYTLMNIAVGYAGGGVPGVIDTLSVYAEPLRWVELVLFNRPFSATRLWFLFALIYVYGLHLLVCKCKLSDRGILILSLAGLALNLILGECLSAVGVELPLHYTRNFLLTGYPFFGLGLWMRHHREKMMNSRGLSVAALLLVGLAMTLASVWYAPDIALSAGSVLITLAAFLIALKGAHIRFPRWQLRLFECSLGIYIFHKPMTLICSKALDILGLAAYPVWYHTLLPLLVCVTTTVAVLIINALQNALKTHRK